MASEVDIAWAAGFFDGEGSTSVLKSQRDRYAYLRISVAQKEPELLEKFKSIVGAGKVYKHKKRDMCSFDCYKKDEVNKVLDLLWPYISDKKKEQAIKAKQIVESYL